MSEAIESRTRPEAAPLPRVGHRPDHRESAWVLTARGAAFWPVWMVVAVLGISEPSIARVWIQGPLALSLVLAAMVYWVHRPKPSAAIRWVTSIVGTGVLGELLAGATTDLGTAPGFSAADDLPRAIGVWMICAVIYEVAPIVANTSRITRGDERHWVRDSLVHAAFAGVALASYAFAPRPLASGATWIISPWMAALIAIVLVLPRCGPETQLTAAKPRASQHALWMAGVVAWAGAIGALAADHQLVEEFARRAGRTGFTPAEGLALLAPLLSVVGCLGSTLLLLVRSRGVRRALSGEVLEHKDCTLVLAREGEDDPVAVHYDGVAVEVGTRVTLLGERRRGRGQGPFRTGRGQSFEMAWPGEPAGLGRALSARAANWLLWGAVSLAGVHLALVLTSGSG